ncbi:sensor histidine kinase [Microbacterium sp. PMB16]|uniref:sensor histidine kinase n=1 Tax=Microbacterium sp. PMB16 TaxID=3120157 RepID=UPI003F4C236A
MAPPSTTPTPMRRRPPIWFRNARPVLVTMTVAMLAAGATDLTLVLLRNGPSLALVTIAATLAGGLASRRLPRSGVLVAAAGTLATAAVGWLPIAEWTIVVFALVVVTIRGLRPLPLAAVAAVAVYLAEVLKTGHWASIDSLAAVTAVVAGATFGTALALHQRFWESLEQRADDAIATREIEAERRVAEERLRIARDLHDIVGHQVAVLSMQLGAIEVATRKDPAIRADLDAARSSVKAVLLESQRILDVLRAGNAEADAQEPSPGIGRISDLVATRQAMGLRIEATIDSGDDEVDPGVDLTAYRIVQEGLTNAQRHGTGTATLRLAVADHRVTIDLTNAVADRLGAEPTGSGYGLVGMRERVASAGGTLTAARDGDRFHVHAVLATDGSTLR